MSARAVVLGTALTATLGAGPLLAQAPGPAPAARPVNPDTTVRSIVNQELEAAAGPYAYDPHGRRDPFVNLLRPVSADMGPKSRPAGLKGFLIQEVALKGIVKTARGFTAMLLGSDGKSYFVGTGDRMFDGVITAMDAATVTFRQEVADPLSTVKSRDVKKTLYPSEEAR